MNKITEKDNLRNYLPGKNKAVRFKSTSMPTNQETSFGLSSMT